MSFFQITMENVRKHKYIKYVTTGKELFGSRTKLSHYKVFPRKRISSRDKKKILMIKLCI